MLSQLDTDIMQTLVRRSTNVVRMTALRDGTTGRYLDNTAAIRASLLTLAMNPVAGAADFPLTFVSGVGPNATWQGVIADTVDLSADEYIVRVTATTSTGVKREFNRHAKAIDG